MREVVGNAQSAAVAYQEEHRADLTEDATAIAVVLRQAASADPLIDDGDLRLRQVQHDLAEAEKAQDGAAVVEFMSRAQRIARVHHFGETDAVNPGGPQYKYPARELLGITEDDASSLRDALMAHFTD